MRARIVCIAAALALAACNGEPPSGPAPPPPATAAEEPTASAPPPLPEPALRPRVFEEEAECAPCHEDVVAAFTHNAMRNSMAPLAAGEGPEALLPEVAWTPEGQVPRVALVRRDGRLLQVVPDPLGGPQSWFEAPVELVVGHGRAARSYVFGRDDRMWMLGVTWYREKDAVALSPGPLFETTILRGTDHLCVNCHTGAAPALAAGDRMRIRAEISVGIGCRRCHGDGAAHALSGDPRDIVNPARLDTDRQAEVCAQCHLSGVLELVRPGRALQDWTPGSPLGAHYGVFARADGVSEGTIGISGHGARMRLSRCFTESADLTCTTCHDPHPVGDRPTTPDAGCLLCHEPAHCGAPAEARGTQPCSDCHMPKVASTDIAHTSTTDHRIRVVRDEESQGPRRRPEETFVGAQAVADRPLVNVLDPEGTLEDAGLLLGAAYLRGVELARLLFSDDAAGYLERALERLEPAAAGGDPDVLLLLGRALALAGRAEEAALRLDDALRQRPDWPEALGERAYVERLLSGASPTTVARFRRAWEADPCEAYVAEMYADVLAQAGRTDEALDVLLDNRRRTGPELRRARFGSRVAWQSGRVEKGLPFWLDRLVFRPRDPVALTAAAEALEHVGRRDDARVLARRALDVDPTARGALDVLERTR